MSSLIPGFEYDIFISYRQKDNKHDGWVTEFVNNLKGELEATFKEDVSVYFDINPHDGLLETYEVADSLSEKLKCLIFIPIISRTYCDPGSFAWKNEFMTFVDMASVDRFGLKVKLPGGNVASRVLPVRIYDLNNEDLKLCETLLGGPLRGIEFIYKSAGVNRPLRASEDHAQNNLNKTYYRDQINKMAHSIHETIQALRGGPSLPPVEPVKHFEMPSEIIENKTWLTSTKHAGSKWVRIIGVVLATAALITLILTNQKLFKKHKVTSLSSAEILDRAITVWDPFKDWDNFTGQIRLIHEKVSGNIDADERIEISIKDDYYKCVTIGPDNIRIVRGIRNGVCFREINGNANPDSSLIKKWGLDSLSISYWKEHHFCHFGLPMELKNSGLLPDKDIKISNFMGKDCLAITFKGDSVKAKNIYFKYNSIILFLDPKTYAVKGCSQTGNAIFDGYVVFNGTIRVKNLNIPLCKTYFNSIDSSFIFVDLFTRAD
jgi:hypothetical protein